MDIPAFLATYGGPGGLAAAAIWWAISDRKFSAERRTELREDIDREQADNAAVRTALNEERAKSARLELENYSLRLENTSLRQELGRGDEQ